mmetsp:Transcript_14691/g.24659  ORF Transcript_14691/g.24659 Transcript_14691/m.24659 type:complete len:236 (+) Transcript_14691:812-1519(+)
MQLLPGLQLQLVARLPLLLRLHLLPGLQLRLRLLLLKHGQPVGGGSGDGRGRVASHCSLGRGPVLQGHRHPAQRRAHHIWGSHLRRRVHIHGHVHGLAGPVEQHHGAGGQHDGVLDGAAELAHRGLQHVHVHGRHVHVHVHAQHVHVHTLHPQGPRGKQRGGRGGRRARGAGPPLTRPCLPARQGPGGLLLTPAIPCPDRQGPGCGRVHAPEAHSRGQEANPDPPRHRGRHPSGL